MSTMGFIRKMKVLPFPEALCAMAISSALNDSHLMSGVIVVGSMGLQDVRQKRS
jgi:hypothetical protein